MTKFGWIVTLIILAILGAGAAAAWYVMQPRAPVAPVVTATTTPDTDLTGQAIYTSGTYGFSIMYPESAKVIDSFPTGYRVPATWRVNPLIVNASGTPIVSIVSYDTESTQSYPRYYTAMIRVGVSEDAKEVAACEKATPDRGETALADVTMNETIWKAFAFQDAAMMKYVKGVSYRVEREGKCYALEKIAVGSSYQDDPASADDIPDATLDAEYAKLEGIVSTFTFVKP